MERLRARLASLLGGFWLVPGAIAVSLAALGAVLVEVDRAAGSDGVGIGFDGDAAAARDILSVIAGSLITVVALTLSLTVVTLQLVAGQFTPRAVRGLLADRLTQVVAGVFVGNVAFALVVLRAVREPGVDGNAFRPAVSTTTAIGLALASLALLIVFVHHMARVIQVSSILGRVGRATLTAADRLYPERFGRGLEASSAGMVDAWREEGPAAVVVRPSRPGYVLTLALDALAGLEGDAVRVAVHVQPGDFVTPRTTAMELWGVVDHEAAASTAAAAVVVDDERDLRQDAAFGLQQLADIAVRALSPGINDPTTAITAIGWVRAVLEALASRELAAPGRALDGDRVEIVTRRDAFDDLLRVGIEEIGRYATSDARVVSFLLDALASVGEEAASAGAGPRVEAIVELGRDLAAPALARASTEADRQLVGVAAARVARLGGATGAA